MITKLRYNRFHIALILGFLILSSGCGKEQNAQAQPQAQTILDKKGTNMVHVAEVFLRSFQPSIEANGTLNPSRYTMLTTLVGGRIESIKMDIGDRVDKGVVLFQVRTVDYELALEQAEANLARAKVLVKDREREKARIENLFQAGSATEQQRDQLITGLDEALASLKQAQAARNQAAQALKDCTIKSPYKGVITAKHRQEGEFAAPGTPVLELMDLSVLNAELELPERYAGIITPGLPVAITTSSGTVEVTGKIIAVNPKIDLKNRTFLVKTAVENPQGKLQAGLFCIARISLKEISGQTAIPLSGLTRDHGRSTVWVVKDNKVLQRQITENGTYEGMVWITSGLVQGEQVVTQGASGLMDGLDVEIIQ